VGVLYKLPFASSTKRCVTILVYPKQLYIPSDVGLAWNINCNSSNC
jgi:hypothetical protein